MLTVEAPYSIYQRFASYYLNRLNGLAAKLDTSFEEAMMGFDEDLGQIRQAIHSLNTAIQIARSIRHEAMLTLLLGNIGYLHLRLGNLDTAQTYLEESITIAKTVGRLFVQLLFSAILFHLTLTAENLSESYTQLCGLIALAFGRKMTGIVLVLLTAIAKWYLLAGDPVRSLQLLDFVSARPELEHEGHYLVERVRSEVAEFFPGLRPTTSLNQSLDVVVADILAKGN